MKKRAVGATLLAVITASVLPASASAVRITDAWARPALDTAVTYFTVNNPTTSTLSLDGAASPVAKRAEIHQSIDVAAPKDDMGSMHMPMGSMPATTMQSVRQVGIKPNSTLRFSPGGYHVMLLGLRHSLRQGETFPLRVHFADSGWTNVVVHVK